MAPSRPKACAELGRALAELLLAFRGAVQAAVVQFPTLGYDEAGKRQELAFLTGGSKSKGIDALYAYTKGNLLVAVSAGNPGAATGNGATQNGDDFGIAAAYTTEFWKVAAGYEDDGVNSQMVISGSYGNGQAEVKAAYGARDDNKDQYAVFGTYILGHTTLNAFFRKDFADLDYTGVGATHDLGGGLSLSAAYATKSGADAIIAHVGTTVGGSIGVTNAVVSWDHTVKVTQDIIDAARSVRKDIFTLTHGGPINTPKDVEFILSKTSADGFVGASSLERMGVEDSLTTLTREFKKVPKP